MSIASKKANFRPELHGIRGLALGLVVVFHLFANGKVSGGIDIFLAITGFLFTSSLLRRVTAGNGRLDFARHFSRIGYRLLPAALLVIAAISISVFVFLPRTRWLQMADEGFASALYHENWQLIWSQLAYGAGGPNSSPFQHFWSLSVQGQFHVIWPLVVIVAFLVARRFQWNAERLLLVVVSVIFVVSFAYANYLIIADTRVAYFHTGTRMWELALGGIAGLLLPHLQLPHWMKITAGWLGFALIVTSGMFFDGSQTFPGYQALWPIMGLILMLAAGHTRSAFGADRWLMTKPFTFVADISYALYLWHWPVMIFYLNATGQRTAGWGGVFIVLALSVLLATLTKKFVEDPFNNRLVAKTTFRRPLVAVVATLAIAATTGFTTSNHLLNKQDQGLAELRVKSDDHPGAAALLSDEPVTYPDDVDPIPDADSIAADWPDIYAMGCTQTARDAPGTDEVTVCRTGSSEAKKRILISGGSKAAQWHPAMEEIARELDWEVITLEKGACQLSAESGPEADPQQNESCDRWNAAALEMIPQLDIDALFTIGTTTRRGEEAVPSGLVGAWEELAEHDIPVIAVRDTPRFSYNVGDCLAAHDYSTKECGGDKNDLLPRDFSDILSEVDIPENVTPLELTHLFCDNDRCEAVIGNVAVYRDIHHVTTAYMRSLAPFLEDDLRESADWLF